MFKRIVSQISICFFIMALFPFSALANNAGNDGSYTLYPSYISFSCPSGSGLYFNLYAEIQFPDNYDLSNLYAYNTALSTDGGTQSFLDLPFVTAVGQTVTIDLSYYAKRNIGYFTLRSLVPFGDAPIVKNYHIEAVKYSDVPCSPMLIFDKKLENYNLNPAMIPTRNITMVGSNLATTQTNAITMAQNNGFDMDNTYVNAFYNSGDIGVLSTQSSLTGKTSYDRQTDYVSYVKPDGSIGVDTVQFTDTNTTYSLNSQDAQLTAVTATQYSQLNCNTTPIDLISSIKTLKIGGTDFIPNEFFWYLPNIDSGSNIQIRPGDGYIRRYKDNDVDLTISMGLDIPLESLDITPRGTLSGFTLESWSQSGSEIIVNIHGPANDSLEEDFEKLALNDLLLNCHTKSNINSNWFKFNSFMVSTFEASSMLDQIFKNDLALTIANIGRSIKAGFNSVADAILHQTNDYKSEEKDTVNDKGSDFEDATSEAERQEQEMIEKTQGYIDDYEPDQSGLEELATSFENYSSLITRIWTAMGEEVPTIAYTFVFSMTLGICLFFLQLKR